MEKINDSKGKQIPFVEIFKNAGKIVWQNRFLLWFGALVALGSPGSFNFSGENKGDFGQNGEAARQFFESHWGIVLAAVLVLLAIGIILFLISLVGKAGLIKSVNGIVLGEKRSFRRGWDEGKKYLGRLFSLFLVFFFTGLVILLVLGIPVVYLVMAQAWIGVILVGILAIAIFIPLAFVLALTNIFAEFYIILSDLGVWGGIEAGYNLLLKNIVNSLIFLLLMLAASMIFMVAFLLVVGVALLILVPAGILFYGLGKVAFGVFLVIAVILFLAFVLFASSIFQTYKITAWVLYFREIARAEEPEVEEAIEVEKREEVAVAPEKV